MQGINPLGDLFPRRHIRFDGDRTLTVHAVDHAGLGRGLQIDEIGDGHLPARGVQGQAFELVQAAPQLREPYQDVHFITHAFRAVGREHQAIGNQSHHVPHADHIRPETRSGFPVHIQLPFDTRQTAVILNVHKAADLLHSGAYTIRGCIQLLRTDAPNLELYRLTLARPLLLLPEFHDDARDIRRALFQIRQNGAGGTAVLPVHELELDSTDHVRCHAIPGARPGTGVEGFNFFKPVQPLFHFLNDRIPFVYRQIPPGPDMHLGGIGFHFRKELNAVVEGSVGHIDAGHRHEKDQQRLTGMAQAAIQKPAVGAAEPARLILASRAPAPDHAAEYRQENEGHDQRRQQAEDDRDGQELHEFAHHPWPEQQRDEYRQGGRSGGDHRPGHADSRLGPCLA